MAVVPFGEVKTREPEAAFMLMPFEEACTMVRPAASTFTLLADADSESDELGALNDIELALVSKTPAEPCTVVDEAEVRRMLPVDAVRLTTGAARMAAAVVDVSATRDAADATVASPLFARSVADERRVIAPGNAQNTTVDSVSPRHEKVAELLTGMMSDDCC